MSRRRTPSFVAEIPLRAGRRGLRTAATRLEVGRQLYNACLQEASHRAERVRHDLRWAAAKALPTKTKAQRCRRARAFRHVRAAFRFGDYALQHFAITTFRRSKWMCDHLQAPEVQKLGTRAYLAAHRILLGQAKRVRFKGGRQFHTLESKSNRAGIRWRGDHVEWNGLALPARIDPEDPVIAHALTRPVKYVRLVRRRIRGTPRLYAQLVCRGQPYRKPTHRVGRGHVGVDVGPSTVAGVGHDSAFLVQLCEPVVREHGRIRVLRRELDRQRRANNPDHYLPDGQVKRGPKQWRISTRQRRTLDHLAELHRREKAHRKTLHGQLANHILAMGRFIHGEKTSTRALQRIFGRSISLRAPGLLLAILRRKAESAGGQIVPIPAGVAKLSQTCHRCGTVQKKPLRQRVHQCACGVVAQRDLYSAFLARHTDADGVLHAGQARPAWPGADPLLRAAWSQALQPAMGRRVRSTFGTPPASWSQSGSLAEERIANAEAQDVRVLGEAAVVPLRTPPALAMGRVSSPFLTVEAALKRLLKPLLFRDEVAPRPVRFGVGRGLVFLLNRRHELQKELGLWEIEAQRIYARWVTPGSTVFDVGAADGDSTLLLARLAAPERSSRSSRIRTSGGGWRRMPR